MEKKDLIIKQYYRIILIFVMQMMFLTVFVTHTFMKTHIYEPSKTLNFIEVILGVIIFSFCLSSIFVVKRLYHTAKEQHLYKIDELKYAHIEEQSKMHRSHKHDLLNHLSILSILAQEERYPELKSYLTNYISEINSVQISVETGLKEMDILLYSKINRAQKKGINIKYNCSCRLDCNQRYIINLISLFGNLIDNAIEANIPSADKQMSITIKEDPLDYIFIIENSFSGDDAKTRKVVDSGTSTKGKDRGQGLTIVKNLVNKFEGIIDFAVSDGIFKAVVELPKHNLQN